MDEVFIRLARILAAFLLAVAVCAMFIAAYVGMSARANEVVLTSSSAAFVILEAPGYCADFELNDLDRQGLVAFIESENPGDTAVWVAEQHAKALFSWAWALDNQQTQNLCTAAYISLLKFRPKVDRAPRTD